MQELSLFSSYPFHLSFIPVVEEQQKKKKDLTIFILDDNPVYLEAMKQTLLQNPHYEVYSFSEWRDCVKNLYRKPDLVIVDYYLEEEKEDGKTGKYVLETIKFESPETEVAIISKDRRIDLMGGLMHEGAKDLIVKNKEALSHIRRVAHEILINKQVKKEWENLSTIVLGIIVIVLVGFVILLLLNGKSNA